MIPRLFCLLLWAVLLPLAEAKPVKKLDIADYLNTNRILGKFAALVQAGDMGTFLSSRGPFTVFAPTDSAFARLPAPTLNALLQPQNKDLLQRIVLYHVYSGKGTVAKDLEKIPSLISCEGQPWTIKMNRLGTQSVQKGRIIHADIRCLNGIIHEIDTLLIPPDAPLAGLAATPWAAPESAGAPATSTHALGPALPPAAPPGRASD